MSFADLEGKAWGYNDACSLSGYFATLQRLREIGCTNDYFSVEEGAPRARQAAWGRVLGDRSRCNRS